MPKAEELRSLVEPIARRHGYILRVEGEALKIKHPDAPFYIEARPVSSGVLVKVGYEGLRDYVRDVVDTEDDPRAFLEDLLDEISMVAHEVYDSLRSAGVSAELDARTAVMDALEELEEAEEE